MPETQPLTESELKSSCEEFRTCAWLNDPPSRNLVGMLTYVQGRLLATITARDATVAAKDAEIERLAELNRLKSHENSALIEDVVRLLTAIRHHRDQRGDDRCWMDDEQLYAALPEGYIPPARDTCVELERCRQFIATRQHPKTEYTSPQREIERLKADNRLHRDKAAGEYWAWQGDGEDRLESLVCPVLIPVAELLKIQGQANAVEDALAAMRVELDDIGPRHGYQ